MLFVKTQKQKARQALVAKSNSITGAFLKKKKAPALQHNTNTRQARKLKCQVAINCACHFACCSPH
jgi:hypothetical protein